MHFKYTPNCLVSNKLDLSHSPNRFSKSINNVNDLWSQQEKRGWKLALVPDKQCSPFPEDCLQEWIWTKAMPKDTFTFVYLFIHCIDWYPVAFPNGLKLDWSWSLGLESLENYRSLGNSRTPTAICSRFFLLLFHALLLYSCYFKPVFCNLDHFKWLRLRNTAFSNRSRKRSADSFFHITFPPLDIDTAKTQWDRISSVKLYRELHKYIKSQYIH